MNRTRRTVGLLFGGCSAEHDVSRMSAANILRALDPEKYDIVPIGISRNGHWLLGNAAAPDAKSLEIPSDAADVALLPGRDGDLIVLDATNKTIRLDVVVPVLHGPNGEDGSVQGLLELAGIPYVGSGIMGSAACMDKDVAKRLLRDAGLPVVPFLSVTPGKQVDYQTATETLGTTALFVKPANMGSSVGVSPARSAAEFDKACALAFRYDTKILVERSVAGAREIECSVLEDHTGKLSASPLGEIAPAQSHGFYSYDAKYEDAAGADLRIPAVLAADVASRIGHLAVEAFRVLGCEGLARVDFFVDPADETTIFLNEINTLPGFTAISMYPKLWEAGGLPQRDLMDVLIGHALARHGRKRAVSNA
ncbi:D-alanine--D-alanine ligase family protein [Microvirga rosea]|uniref:D-alanine--D-alanine ligase family protein n=1 Tax=Microvirga rosea TaxID=2715425 RepID=UPI001D0B8AFF|nr:D-alanine--D-alanine ligase family protein [Microvirga rosea]MCB8823104.1 D-alanine--D-alanine ligase [Microvirga rosea]